MIQKRTLVNFRVAPLSDFQKRRHVCHSSFPILSGRKKDFSFFSERDIHSKKMGELFQTVSHSILNRFYNSVLRLSQK